MAVGGAVFKTRALAAKACELSRVRSNGALAKAAREVRVGDRLNVTTEGGLFEVEVLVLSEVRGPASVAQTLYREFDESKEARLKLAAEKKAFAQFEELPVEKPTGRDRRMLSRLRGRG
ncbi:RNA-binding S4 domain-containing protein [Granulicella cerasi]|uniref:RNA-binding S4 domain-containing protein n=1 Tax=Granulicella cerasi TaxID=741063 RepID=A0ABW1Z8T7_9BACT